MVDKEEGLSYNMENYQYKIGNFLINMEEKLVIVHRDGMQDWLTWPNPPVDIGVINRALGRIEELEQQMDPNLVIEIRDEIGQVETFRQIAKLVGKKNTAVVVGARESVCVKTVIKRLDEAGISYRKDRLGIVD